MAPLQPSLTCWVLCERFQHVDGTWSWWQVVDQVSPATDRSHLESFEREGRALDVSERRVMPALVTLTP